MEKLRTQTQYQRANDPPGLPPTAAQKIVNRLLRGESPLIPIARSGI
jgi:hypothetical protein